MMNLCGSTCLALHRHRSYAKSIIRKNNCKEVRMYHLLNLPVLCDKKNHEQGSQIFSKEVK